MGDIKFNPSVHTVHFFEQLSKKHKKNKSKMANEMSINRTTMYRWITNAESIRVDNENITNRSRRRPKQSRIKIPTINQLFEFIKKQPDHIHYAWCMVHMNSERKSYNASIQKVIDLIREYQEGI